MAFKDLEILADPPGEAFIQRTSLYEQHLEPFCRFMDAQIRNKTVLGTNESFRDYAHIVRWPIRKLEYSFVLYHALPLMGAGRRPRILEAGCGVTPLPHLFVMMGAEVDAVDYDAHTIEVLKTGSVKEIYGFPVNHQWMDLRGLAFPDASFDLITCVSVIEHLGNGDEGLVLAEIMRVLKPGGKAIVTTDVRGGGGGESSRGRARRFDEPFDFPTLNGLLAPYQQMLEGGPDQLKRLSGLQDNTIETFWTSHWNQESSWQGNRGYVALGIVLSKPQTATSSNYAQNVPAETLNIRSRADDAADRLLRSQIQRTIELERELERKEKVIQELHAEAERRREALEAVTTDRDTWEARYQHVMAQLDVIAQKPSSVNSEKPGDIG